MKWTAAPADPDPDDDEASEDEPTDLETALHAEFQMDLSCLVDGELDEEAARRALGHIESCEQCRDFFEDTRAQIRLHRDTVDPDRLLSRISALTGSSPEDDQSELRAIDLVARLATIFYQVGKAYTLVALEPDRQPDFEPPVQVEATRNQGRGFIDGVVAGGQRSGSVDWQRSRQLLSGALERVSDPLEKGRRLLEEALGIDPSHEEARIYLAFVDARQGRVLKARDGWQSVFRTGINETNRGHAAVQLASLYASAGELRKAIACNRWIVATGLSATDERFFFVHFNIGALYLERGDVERALAAFRRLLDEYPDRLSDVVRLFDSSEQLRARIDAVDGLGERLEATCPELFVEADERAAGSDELERELRERLALGDVAGFQAALGAEPETDSSVRDRWHREFRFFSSAEAETDRGRRRRGLWLVLAERNGLNGLELPMFTPPEGSPPVPPANRARSSDARTPAERGRRLEEAVEALFQRLFELATAEGDDEIVLEHVRRQGAGYQFGYDVQVRYRHHGTVVNLAIECKHLSTPLSPDKVVHKWAQLEDSDQSIDHWILISPSTVPTPVLWHLVDKSQRIRRYPFHIQVWCPQSGVENFFRLLPEHGEEYFGPCASEAAGSDACARQTARRWLDKLQPRFRLPPDWHAYLLDPRKQRMRHESHTELEQAYARRVPLRCSDADHQPLGTLDAYVRSWLCVSSSRVLFVFGGFGAGKTFSSYALCRELSLEFLANPVTGTLCLRLPLRTYRRFGSIDALLKDSLDRIGVSLADWHLLCADARVLIVLDGFDEMSIRLDQASIERNVDELQAACRDLGDVKILVTSRTRFFGNLKYERHLRERLESPEFVYLEPLRRRECLQGLRRHALGPSERVRINELAGMNDPIGLARRPLFYRMIQDALVDLPAGPIDQTSLYERYVRGVLERNEERLDPAGVGLSRRAVHENLLSILERIALALVTSGHPFVYLAELASTAEKELARSLFETSDGRSADLEYDSAEQDATGRVGIRSVLALIEGVEHPERWPVDFSDRSMREYFVARALLRALKDEPDVARELLCGASLSRETLEFAAEKLRKDGSDELVDTLVQLGQATRAPGYAGGSAGPAVGLVLRVKDELPERDWSGARLDGVDFTNANLRGKDFSNASLRNAIVANSDLEETRLCNADFYGVDLWETGRIQALCPVDEETILVGYDRGIVRQWNLAAGRDEPQSVFTDGDRPASQLYALGDDSIFLRSRESVLFLDRSGDGTCAVRSEFELRGDFVALALAQGRAVLALEAGDATALRYCDLDRCQALREWRVPVAARHVHDLALCGDQGVVLATAEGTLFFPFDGKPEPFLTRGVHVVATIRESPGTFLVAGGDKSGRVHVWELRRKGDSWTQTHRGSQQVHGGSITALAWLHPSGLVTGGGDRLVRLLGYVPWESRILQFYRSMTRRLRCRGARVAGLVPDKARAELCKGGAVDAN